ncbi:ATP-binding response regulator [Sphingomonas sp. PAMC 26617]|uniref:ATP-binding response regulator n=1 Tax=Sphingomonas sp. PAMC 26617 TaxID=1112216 RepID=UPI001E65B6EC|nr:ATP-binding protein [Sphingomonas sp. PAMC 26617]
MINRVFATANPDTSAIELREAHQIAYDIFKAAGNQGEALTNLEALKALDDKTSTLAASANTALAAARFDFASQELKIEKLRRAQLQRDIDDAKLRARTQRTIIGGLAIASGIIVGLLTFGLVTIRRSRNEVRAANLDLAETNAALAKALAAKTEFLATTSHEIRTPLNGILGMTQVMLADRAIDPAVRERITVVHGAGVTMRALVDDILDVAKMETGNLTIEAVPFDLRTTLTEVSRLWEDQSRARGVRFVLDLADCPPFVVGDSARLRQIAFNLLSNALKFTEQGTVTLRAVAEGEWLALSVADSGIGIPADKLDLIFESFRQVDAGTTRKFGGTGLGLAICRNLARAMHGDIAVASVPGQGSTFTVRLPLVRANGPEAALPMTEQSGDTLLIVDRNPISRSMLRAVLEPRASAVAVASSIDQAIDRIAQGGVTRLLIDEATIRAMPDEAAALARVGELAVPCALLWTTPSAQDQARFASAGIALVIAKPIAGTALADQLFDEIRTAKSPISGLVSQAA